MRKKKRSSAGFMLLEVLVAVTVLSFGITMLMKSFSSSLRATEASLNLSTATFLAQKKLSEIQVNGIPEEDPEFFSGTFEDHPRFKWEIKALSTSTPDLLELKLGILWQERGRQKELRLTTYSPGNQGTGNAEEVL